MKMMPCLWFANEAEEAMKFYTTVFPKSRVKEETRAGAQGPFPKGTLIAATLDLDGNDLMLLNGAQGRNFSEATSLVVQCETQDEIDRYWRMLNEGGQEQMCGWLKDRFGVSWQIVPTLLPSMLNDKDPAKAARAMAAMMQMKKLDIAALKAAQEGR